MIDGTKGPVRYGTNVVSLVYEGYGRSASQIAIDFDPTFVDPTLPEQNAHGDAYLATQQESGIAQGDSGGPMFMRRQGVPTPIGVNRMVIANPLPPNQPRIGFGSQSIDVCILTWLPEVIQAFPDIRN